MKTKLFLLSFVALLACCESETNDQVIFNRAFFDFEYSYIHSISPEHAVQIHSLIEKEFGYAAKLIDITKNQKFNNTRTAEDPCWFSLGGTSVSMEMVDEGNGTICAAYKWNNGAAHLSCWRGGQHIGYWCYAA